jgi:hypothetical protein
MNEFKMIEHKIDYFLLTGNLEQNALGSAWLVAKFDTK